MILLRLWGGWTDGDAGTGLVLTVTLAMAPVLSLATTALPVLTPTADATPT